MTLALTSKSLSGLPCRVELSRTRRLRNSIRVQCERGGLELARGEFARVRIRFDDVTVRDALTAARPARVEAQWGDEEPPIGYQVFRAEIDDWIQAINTAARPVLAAESALGTVRLIEQAYRARRPLPEPWTEEGLQQPARLARRSAGRARRVLVTGASGFIGCRLAEVLSLREGCDVRALVRNPSGAARLARLPVEMVSGDVCSSSDVARAMDGVDAVVHCAVGTSWRRAEVVQVTVMGTKTVAEAATTAGVERFVHISSIAVHGNLAGATLDERTPLIPPDADGYGGDKRRAEDEVRRCMRKGLRAVILRPARVFGPFGRTFTTRPVEHLVRGRFTLVGAYEAPASMVYVDNVVEAIIQALRAGEAALGEVFAVSEPDPLSWRAFYQTFAEALGAELHLGEASGTRANASTAGWFRRMGNGMGEILTSPELRGFARRCLETDPVGTLPRKLWEVRTFRSRLQRALGMTDTIVYRPTASEPQPEVTFYADPALVLTGKAMDVLGYRPVVSQSRAVEITLDWLRHARIV
jgi:nucleoside-diphosphate-sugar epimerase